MIPGVGIKTILEIPQHEIAQHFIAHEKELEREISQAVAKAIAEFDFDREVADICRVRLRTALEQGIKRYFEYDEGAKIVNMAVLEAMDKYWSYIFGEGKKKSKAKHE